MLGVCSGAMGNETKERDRSTGKAQSDAALFGDRAGNSPASDARAADRARGWGETIAWTEATRAEVLPRRGRPVVGRWLDGDAEAMRQRLARLIENTRERFDNGLARTRKTSPEAARLAETALVHFLDGTGALRVEEASVALSLLWWADQYEAPQLLASYFATTRSPAFLVEGLAGMRHYSSKIHLGDRDAYWIFPLEHAAEHVGKRTTNAVRSEALEYAQYAYRAARPVLAQADDESYAAARDRAAEEMVRLPLGWRCAMAYVFPDEPAWAAEQARACIADGLPSAWYVRALLASIADAEIAEGLAHLVKDGYEQEPLYYTLVDTLGPDAAPALRVLITDRKILRAISALRLIIHEKGMAAMAALLAKKATAKRAMSHFDKHPALALRALGPLMEAKHPLSAAAKTAFSVLAARHPEAAKAARGALGGEAAAESEAGDPFAATVDLPRVLADPPWRRPREAAPPPSPITGLSAPGRFAAMCWEPGERAHWSAQRGAPWWDADMQRWTRSEWKTAFAPAELARALDFDTRKVTAMIFWGPKDLALAAWNHEETISAEVDPKDDWLRASVGRFEEAFLPGLLRLHAANKDSHSLDHFKVFEDAGVEAAVEYDGNVAMGHIEDSEALTLRTLTFHRSGPGSHPPLPLAAVDPIVVSEVLRDLDSLNA